MNYESRDSAPIKSFTDLNAWKIGHSLVLAIYKETKLFPKDATFGLTNQIRRASVSVASNIAEGFSRQSYKDKIQFYAVALGSLTEVQNQLVIARDIGYLDHKSFDSISMITIDVSKLLNGLIKHSKTLIQNS